MEELCNVAESLIVPVRMGIARPTAPFTLASTSIDAVQGSEELFSVEPLPPRPSPDQSNRLVVFHLFIFLSGGCLERYIMEYINVCIVSVAKLKKLQLEQLEFQLQTRN